MASTASTATSAASCITINVKTMDASDFTMSVQKNSTIPDLKSKIAGHTGFANHRQRLIFQGRVLRNDKNMASYSIADGHTIHLVVRPADLPITRPSNDSPPPTATTTAPRRSEIIMGARITVAENVDSDLRNLFSNLFNALGSRPQNQVASATSHTRTETQSSEASSIPSHTERLLQALHDGRRQDRLLNRTQRLLRDASNIMRRCERSCGIGPDVSSEPDSEPAESESTAAPTSTTVNASAGTVPSNIPTTATSEAAAAAAMSNEASLPIEVTRQAAPNRRTLREINNLLVEMRNILFRGMLPIERVAHMVEGYRMFKYLPQEGPQMANTLGEALKAIGKLCVRTAYHLKYIMSDHLPSVGTAAPSAGNSSSRRGKRKNPRAARSTSQKDQAAGAAAAAASATADSSSHKSRMKGPIRRKKKQKNTKRKRPRLSQTRSSTDSAPAPEARGDATNSTRESPAVSPRSTQTSTLPAGASRPFRLLHAAASMLAQQQRAVDPTASTSASAASSTTSTPSFGRHVILQVSPAMSFGPFSHVAVIPANLRLALQRVAAGQSSAGSSSSSDAPSQRTQTNSERNVENGNDAQE